MKQSPARQKLSADYVDTYLLQMKQRSDQLMDFFVFAFFLTGLLLSFVYETWMVGLTVGGLCSAAYYLARITFRTSNLYQYVLAAIFGVFMAQYMYQLHSSAEMHFFAFIGSAILIFYQNWKLQLPLAFVVLLNHAAIGYQHFATHQAYFPQLNNMDLQTYLMHGLLSAVFFFISGLLAYNFKKYSRRSISQTMQMAILKDENAQEKKLQATEKMLSEAQKLACMGSWNVDIEKREIFWSEGTKATYGITGEFVASFDTFLKMVHPDDKEWVLALTGEAEKTGATLDYEFRIVRPDGEVRWLHGQNQYEKDDSGNVVRIAGISKDITEQKAAEQKNKELVENLQLKNKDLEMFAYMVSHNLRSPIAKILGMADIFRKSPELRDKMADYIYNEIINLDNVVKDMNTIVTARNSKNAQREYIEFGYLFNLVLKVLEPEIADAQAVVTPYFVSAEGVVTVRSYIYSILYNLLSNAVKYRRPEVQLHIHVSSSLSGKYVCLTVADNGKGINLPRYSEKLFGLYNRFHADDAPGKGIGLNLVKTQIDSLGGYIEVDSEVDKGTTFRVFFPNELHDAMT
jgi:PAS domain S-box-containing protein